MLLNEKGRLRSVAQLVEHRSPKPGVGGSIPLAPATFSSGMEFTFLSKIYRSYLMAFLCPLY